MNTIQSSENNQYLIKSLLNNQYFTFDKKDSLKYIQTTSLQCDKDFYWTIISLDQDVNFNSKYSLRFGEFIQIFTIKSQNQYQYISKQPLFIQQPDTSIISSQTFKKFNDNQVKKQPCVFINSENNFYLTINKDKIIFQEQPNPGSYFQIIPLFEKELQLNRPIIEYKYEFEIRNYVTGYSLNSKSCFSEQLLTAIRKNKRIEKWTLIKDNDCDKKYQILNVFWLKYIHTEDTTVNLIEKNPPKIGWEISTIDEKEISYGVPFIIQNSFTKYFLTMNVLNLKEPANYEQEAYQSQILMPTSLWIIFNHFI